MALQQVNNGDSGLVARTKINDTMDEVNLRELLANKVTDFTSPNNDKYPTSQAVVTKLGDYELLANKVTDFTSPNNNKYPTSQAVWNNRVINNEVVGGYILPVNEYIQLQNETTVKNEYLFNLPALFKKKYKVNYSPGDNNGCYAGAKTFPMSGIGGYTFEVYIGFRLGVDIFTKIVGDSFSVGNTPTNYLKIGEFETDTENNITKYYQWYQLFNGMDYRPIPILPYDYAKIEFNASNKINFGNIVFSKDNKDYFFNELIKTNDVFKRGNVQGIFENTPTTAMYYLFAIFSDNGLKDYFASTSTTPTLPINFDDKYLIGYANYDAIAEEFTNDWTILDIEFLEVVKKYSEGTQGGNTVVGFNDIDFTDVLVNQIAGININLTSNIITLPAGDYLIRGKSSMYNIRGFLSLFDDDTDTELIYSITQDATSSGFELSSNIDGHIHLGIETNLKLKLYSNIARTNGMGTADNMGHDEIYAGIMITKIK